MTTLATVITGASSGIGEALAHLFAPEQQTLVLVGSLNLLLRQFLVNLGCFGISAPFAKSDGAKTSAMMQLNMVALTELTHMALPAMLERRHGGGVNSKIRAGLKSGDRSNIHNSTMTTLQHRGRSPRCWSVVMVEL